MSLIPSKTQNPIVTNWNFRSIFAENIGFSPAYVSFYVDPETTEEIRFGQPLQWMADSVTFDNKVITGGYVEPFKANWNATEGKFETPSNLATIALNPNGIGPENSGEVRGVVLGTIITKFLDFEGVSNDPAREFRIDDFMDLGEVDGVLLSPNIGSSDILMNLSGISSISVSN